MNLKGHRPIGPLARREVRNMNKNIIIAGIVALLIGGGIGFFGGMQYQKSQAPQGGQFARTFEGGNGGRGRFGSANGMAVRGQIISVDNNSITVKLADGSTKIVVLSSSTMIGKSTVGTVSDLANGANVTIFGTTNSDGSVTAQNVQVGNLMFAERPSGSPMPAQTGSATSAPTGY